MAKFTFQPLVPSDRAKSAKLGNNTVANGGGLNDKDVNKFLKLVAADTYDLCAAGDEIEGVMVAYDPATQDGYAFGSFVDEGRFFAILTATATMGGLVVADAPVARGTALAGYPSVKPGAPVNFKWRIISGGLTAGSTVLIERVNA